MAWKIFQQPLNNQSILYSYQDIDTALYNIEGDFNQYIEDLYCYNLAMPLSQISIRAIDLCYKNVQYIKNRLDSISTKRKVAGEYKEFADQYTTYVKRKLLLMEDLYENRLTILKIYTHLNASKKCAEMLFWVDSDSEVSELLETTKQHLKSLQELTKKLRFNDQTMKEFIQELYNLAENLIDSSELYVNNGGASSPNAQLFREAFLDHFNGFYPEKYLAVARLEADSEKLKIEDFLRTIQSKEILKI